MLRPAIIPAPTAVGTVNANTGEILDEDTPRALDGPDLHNFRQVAQGQSGMAKPWHYTHDGD